MKKYTKIFFLLFLSLFFISCANNSATVSPTANLTKKSYHVSKLPQDGRGIDKIIASDLRSRGYKATTGPKKGSASAIVTYQDKWMWDMTMYMLQLEMQVLDAKTGSTLATGKSYRPSLQRKSPAGMVKEVLDQIFSKQ